MKQILTITLIALCKFSFAQYMAPSKAEYITVKGDSTSFAQLKNVLFDEGFTYVVSDGILVTDGQMKFGPDKYILTARILFTDTGSYIVLRPRIDASLRSNVYTQAFAGVITNNVVVTPAVVGFNSSHNKAYEYTLWIAEKIGTNIKFGPGKAPRKMYPKRYPK